MARIGILRHFLHKSHDTVDYAFIAKRTDEYLEDVIVLCRQGGERWDYRMGKVHYPMANVFDGKTLYSHFKDTHDKNAANDVIAIGEEAFLTFDILRAEYDFFLDENRFFDERYVKNVFEPWKSRVGAAAAKDITEYQQPNAVYDPGQWEMIQQFDVIMHLAEFHDPLLYMKDVNGCREDGSPKEFTAMFGPIEEHRREDPRRGKSR